MSNKRLNVRRLVREAAQILQRDLPQWPGASKTYSLAYRMLAIMNEEAQAAFLRRRTPRKRDRYFPPEDVNDLVRALDKGDEERSKGNHLGTTFRQVESQGAGIGKIDRTVCVE